MSQETVSMKLRVGRHPLVGTEFIVACLKKMARALGSELIVTGGD